MANKKPETPPTPRRADKDPSEKKVDATTGDPKYDLAEKPTPEPHHGGNGDPPDPERKPPPTHEPVQPYDPIREPIEGDQDLGKRSETTPGRQ